MVLLRGRADRPPRRGTPADYLLVGLGNPGKEYERSRHNVGAEAVSRLAAAHGATLKAGKERALVAEIRIGDQRVALAFPTTFMNLSGEAVQQLVRRHGIDDPAHIVVIHDELDLPPGTVRVKLGGGLAGHNGLGSIVQHLKTNDFARIRIGVGKPPSKEHGADHVLRRIPKAERELLDESVIRATEAAELLVERGIETAMQSYNRS